MLMGEIFGTAARHTEINRKDFIFELNNNFISNKYSANLLDSLSKAI